MASQLRRVTCSIGLAAMFCATESASAAVYAGETSQRDPIVVNVDKKGQVGSVGLMWDADCKSGQAYTFARTLTATKKKPSVVGLGTNPLFGNVKKGRLKANGLSSAVFGNQSGGLITHKISGKFKKKSASGTLSGHMNVLNPEGNVIDTCDTGTVRWGAQRGPNAYGGFTTAGDPVVVITNASRTKVDYFGFGWQADCQPDGFWHIGEEFGNFPLLATGGFGDKFTNDYPHQGDAGKNSFAYDIQGTVRKKIASGTIGVHVDELDSTGTAARTCDSNSVKWSARQ